MSAVVIDCWTFALRSSGQMGSGQLTWLEQWRATPTNIWEPIAKRQATQISTETMGALVSSNTKIEFLRKMATVKVKATLEQDVLLENFSSLHSMSCWIL